ncbi:MAG: NusG domain II-containing protein [Deltaproteobacteria bacterium]|nr:NusG domain II-containing protein [Deltaproteobacteria bacterium]
MKSLFKDYSSITLADKILVGVLVLVVVLWSFLLFHGKAKDLKVEIYNKDGLYGVYPLSETRTIRVPGPLGYTVVYIESGKAYIQISPCPNKICVHMGKIWLPSQSVVCIPNRVVVRISGKVRHFDALTY